jgi:hypothetical protein
VCVCVWAHASVLEREREITYIGTLIDLCFTFYRAVGRVF